ncbi:MAG TPA: DUF721 domain-containing protein [Pyrinomonadaceae bacterium]|nr:DUF721 domain-containing protein [Pyrinomonadaceae bacterium]
MEPIFATIPGIVYGLDVENNVTPSLAFAAWRNIAGDLLNERTVATKLEDSQLTVAVEDETWQKHLEGLAPQMVARLNGALRKGEVKRIEFVIDANAVTRSKANTRRPKAEWYEVPESLVNAAKAIPDEGLRENFVTAAAAYLAVKSVKVKT